jgi:hypothetical protein
VPRKKTEVEPPQSWLEFRFAQHEAEQDLLERAMFAYENDHDELGDRLSREYKELRTRNRAERAEAFPPSMVDPDPRR